MAWLLLVSFGMGGCLFGVNVPNDVESENFVGSVASQVLTPGSENAYRDEASKELLRHFSVDQFAQLTTKLRATFGQPIKPIRSSGVTQVVIGSADGTTKILQYSVVAQLQHGTARIAVEAAKKNNVWQLTGLDVNAQPSPN